MQLVKYVVDLLW